MADQQEPRYEVTMHCGDTDSSNHEWKVELRCECLHCNELRTVTHVRDTKPGMVEGATAPTTPAQIVRDTAYGYASAYGYAAQQLQFILCDANLALEQAPRLGYDEWRERVRRIRDLADRGIAEANDALRRYDAQIERIESGTQL